ncbi:alpha/beta-hydrolase [Choiromyces venosus 120613-1]|uniref:Alpha/beta-hydrolase n=1 Tax=Choiromyces venosus 120613-1 TaxID=1336337 RepID=A0A3N4JR73_9PEZI|nr:alpha/beta-hydrolase [Choiromyces venosus 120613-1]
MLGPRLLTLLSALAGSYIQATTAAPAPVPTPGLDDLFNNILDDVVKTGKDILGDDVPSASTGTLDPKLLPKIQYFAEFAAAAYCDPNHVVGAQVTCAKNVCPEITANNITTILEFANTRDTDTTGVVLRDDTTSSIVISIRGSKSLRNWLANVQVELKDVPEICTGCKVHSGFHEAMEEALPSVMKSVQKLRIENPGYGVVAVGHSLGGAIATLMAEEFRKGGVKVDLYTFGAPRIGNEQLSSFISKTGTNFRVTHTNDPVPRLPPVLLGFQHISPEYWISKGDTNIKASDIQIFEGGINRGGNGNGPISLNTPAHAHYLLPVEISSCSTGGFEF